VPLPVALFSVAHDIPWHFEKSRAKKNRWLAAIIAALISAKVCSEIVPSGAPPTSARLGDKGMTECDGTSGTMNSPSGYARCDTAIAPGITQTAFSASESHFAHLIGDNPDNPRGGVICRLMGHPGLFRQSPSR
jgi:hypothetical protein